jgi:peptide-methionine (S)-S-oxide reductase
MDQNNILNQDFYSKIALIESGSTKVMFQKKRYILSKEILQSGKVIKVYAEELGGNNFISFNMYKLKNGWELKPCKMLVEKSCKFYR